MQVSINRDFEKLEKQNTETGRISTAFSSETSRRRCCSFRSRLLQDAFYNSHVRRRWRVVVLCFNEYLKFNLFVFFFVSALFTFFEFSKPFFVKFVTLYLLSAVCSMAGRQVLIRLALWVIDADNGKTVTGRPSHSYQPTIERVRDTLCAPSRVCLRHIRAQNWGAADLDAFLV